MKHEDHPLGRAEALQQDQQRQADAVIQGDPVGGVGQPAAGGRGNELALGGVMGPLPASPGGPDPVQAQAAGHHDQPPALILNLTDVRGQQAGERILDGILGGTDVAEHPEGEIDQVGAVLPERLDDPRAVAGLAQFPVLMPVRMPQSAGQARPVTYRGRAAHAWGSLSIRTSQPTGV
jgi:hypothetical protein